MTTNARIITAEGHIFTPAKATALRDSRADGKGMRKFTLADARKMDPVPLPSVTTILKTLHKQALVEWLIEQACLALMTTPRLPGEADDAFVQRVLHTEHVQDQEAQTARDRGTEIHAAMEDLFCGKPIAEEINPWVRPAFLEVQKYGELACTEKILVGDGYAGKTDLIQQGKDECWWLWTGNPQRHCQRRVLTGSAFAIGSLCESVGKVQCTKRVLQGNPYWQHLHFHN